MSLIKLKNNALDNLTSFEGSASLGDMVLVSSATASSSASIEFTLGDYKEYKFFFVNIHPQNDNGSLSVTFSTDGGSTYGLTKTSTYFRAYHNEGDSEAVLTYEVSEDLAQSTSYQNLSILVGADNDQSTSGTLYLFTPSSDTFVKHFISRMNGSYGSDFTFDQYVAGYGNTTSAINAVDFKMPGGNIDSGTIHMYGIA